MGQADLRPAEAGDVAAIADCARAAYARYVSRIGREPAPMVADFSALVAAGEDVAGFIVIRPGPGHLFIENVAVHPDRQGQGLGHRLMVFGEAAARERGLPALELYTNAKMTENFPFYSGLGFVETERRHEDGFDRVYMRKRLT